MDDGSRDRSGMICDSFTDERIKVIHKVNNGLSAARNTGLSAATGDYIMFLDGDDYIDENMCLSLYDSLVKNSADMSVCNINNIYENGDPVDDFNNASPITGMVMSKEDYYNGLLKAGNWYYIVMWNKLFKKELFSDIRFPEGRIHEDEFLIHRIAYRCNRISTVTERLYNYVQRRGSITNKKYSPKRLDVMDALFDRERFYIENAIDENIIVMHLVATIRVLWSTYKKAVPLNDEFRARYKVIHKECKALIKKVLKYKMSFMYRGFLLANLFSLKLTYNVIGKYKE